MTDATPPILPSAPPPLPYAPKPSAVARFFSAVRHHVVRAFRPRWDAGVATPEERALLATPRPNARVVTGAEAQDYVAWRRSLCVVAFWTLAVTVLVSFVLMVIELAQFTDEDAQVVNTSLYGLLEVVRFLGTEVVPLGMLWMAMKGWHDLRWSHRRLLWGWGVGLAVAFGLALFPMGWLVRTGAPGDRETVQVIERGVGLIYGVKYLMFLLPAVLSVLVGAIRSSMVVKTYMPESALPGWVAAAAAPVLALLILVLAAFFTQLSSNLLIVIGSLALIAKYVLPLRHAARIARPHRRAEVEAFLRPMRVQGWVLGAIGGVCLAVAAFSADLFGLHPVGWEPRGLLNPFKALLLILDFSAKAVMAAIVFSDWLMAVLRYTWSEGNAFRASPLSPTFEAKILQLDAAGIGTLGRRSVSPEASPPAA